MNLPKIGIIQGDSGVALQLQNSLQDLNYAVTAPASNYSHAIDMLEVESPDIVLMDVTLDGDKDGIDLAMLLKHMDIPFIFVTARADKSTVNRAKKLQPSGYLVKPFTQESLYVAIEIALYNKAHKKNIEEDINTENSSDIIKENAINKNSINIKRGKYKEIIYIKDILYIKSKNSNITIFTKNMQFDTRAGINTYLKYINNEQFQRIHKSYAVNISHITAIGSNSLMLSDLEIPIGRFYRSTLLKYINI